MSPPLVVLIAASDLLPGLRQRLGQGDVLTFPDADVRRALDAIVARRPSRVVLERRFASTSRGAALVRRLHSDPLLEDVVVQVVPRDGGDLEDLQRRPREAPGPARSAAARPPDASGTRRAPRIRIREGLEVLVDGRPARLVDLSALGAQVASSAVLKPNQQVRISLVDDAGALRLAAQVAWAVYELPRGAQPQYRAGIAFLDGESDLVTGFALRHERRA